VFGGYIDIEWNSERKKSVKKNGNTFIFSFNENDTIEKFNTIKE
jgi:hypothetical protein